MVCGDGLDNLAVGEMASLAASLVPVEIAVGVGLEQRWVI
jgi:hypothetical protein